MFRLKQLHFTYYNTKIVLSTYRTEGAILLNRTNINMDSKNEFRILVSLTKILNPELINMVYLQFVEQKVD